jgi:hypothetical protein
VILIDPSEAPHLPSALMSLPHKVLSSLEDATGADIVLSTWSAPVTTDSLAWQHVRRGVGYQLKRGEDLVASIKDGRAMYQLAKMRKTWDECWGVFVGGGLRDWKGELVLGEGFFSYKSYLSHIRNWQRAGGMWLTLDPLYPFAQWVQDELQRMEHSPVRILRKPQVHLIPLSPQEETLASFPLVGPNRAKVIWNGLIEHGCDQTLTQALVNLSDGFLERLDGIGSGVTKAARRHLGLREEEDLGIYTDNDFLKLKGGGD